MSDHLNLSQDDMDTLSQDFEYTNPDLSKMALYMLAIPAMSCEVERVFSSTGLTITDRRNRYIPLNPLQYHLNVY